MKKNKSVRVMSIVGTTYETRILASEVSNKHSGPAQAAITASR